MKFDRREIVEIVGVLAVALSLLFVGQQLRQDRRVALAEQYSFRSESMKADLRSQLESEMFMANRVTAWERGDRPRWWTEIHDESIEEANLSVPEVQTFILQIQLIYYQDDNLYYQYQQGLSSEEFWLSVQSNLERRLRRPIERAIYSDRAIEREIDSVVAELLIKIDSE